MIFILKHIIVEIFISVQQAKLENNIFMNKKYKQWKLNLKCGKGRKVIAMNRESNSKFFVSQFNFQK